MVGQSTASNWLEGELQKQQKNTKEKVNKNKTGMRKLRSWFYDSENDSENENSDMEERNTDEEEWEEINRKDRNRERKEKQTKNRRNIQAKTASKASHMVGLGPITKETINHFVEIHKDIEVAKIEAIKEFLEFYLRYDKNEIEKLDIGATQSAPNDNIIYVDFTDKSDLHTVYARTAQCKHPDVITRNYIPPQFFDRYIYLSKKCQEIRTKDKDTKTQIRFGKTDVEVYTKTRGHNEQYRQIKLEDICEIRDIPSFDFDIKWRRKDEQAQRRRADQSPARGKPPSMINSVTAETNHALSRNNSLEGAPRKRSKTSDSNQDESL